MNNVMLSGRLGADPTIKRTEKGLTIGEFSLAVERPYQKGKEKKVDFIPCIAFGQKAEFAEKYLRKGLKIIVVGSWEIEIWTNRDGNKMKTHHMNVDKFEFCESKSVNMSIGNFDKPLSTPQSDAMPEEMNEKPSAPKTDDFLFVPDDLADEVPFL